MTDCIIVGGGLIGMLSARELTKAGLDVLLLDKGELGKESSWAGGGILSPLHPWRYPEEVSRLAKIGHLQYPEVAQTLYDESGIDPEYVCSGMLVVDSNEKLQAIEWAKKWSMNLSVIDRSDELQDVSPGLSANYHQGIWMPDIGQMRNPRLVRAAKGSLETLNIHYKEHTDVQNITIKNGTVTGVETADKTYFADKVLISGGAWSAQLLKSYSNAPDIQPVKGQMILFKGVPGLLKRIILAENRYLIPRKDGRILCGSSIEHSGFDKAISKAVKKDLLQSAKEIFPELEKLPVEHHWAGLRPGSPDGVPIIGAHAEIDGLYMNSGHFRNGVILGLGSAQHITQLICGG